MNIEEEITKVRSAFDEAKSDGDADSLRVKFTGRNGEIRRLFGELKNVAKELKGKIGQALNNLKKEFEAEIEKIASSSSF